MSSLVYRTVAPFVILIGLSIAHAEPIRIPKLPPGEGDGLTAAIELSDIVTNAIVRNDFERVEEALTYYAKTKERMDDGRWLLSFVRAGIESSIDGSNLDRTFFRIADWKKKVPGSVGAVFYEFAYWNHYAWNARGGGYASTVTEEGWKLFRERLLKAEAALTGSKTYASENPEWYVLYLRCALVLDWTLEERVRLFAEAVKREPYYYETYFAMVQGFSPKWGGDYALVAKLADEAIRATQKEDGTSMYARIYWNLSQNEGIDVDIFKDAGASWPRMKKGFEELQARYPDVYRMSNVFAAFACRARDKEAFLKLLPIIQTRPYPDVWPTNYSFDLCTRMFTKES